MKIALLQPCNEEYKNKERNPLMECNPGQYFPDASFTEFQIFKATASQQVMEIAAQGFDAFFNLCDGALDEDWPGIEVVQTLEQLNLPFTGAGSAFYDPTRESMKMAAYSSGVKIPNYTFVHSTEQTARALDKLSFPMIVKPKHGASSVGLTEDSRVTDSQGLHREVKRMIDEFGGALVEEFIEGREYTVLVTEPRDGEDTPLTYPPVEFVFTEKEAFRYYHLKWVDFPPIRLVEDEALSAALQHASALTFEALSGTGYARCDFRVDVDGEVFLLEVNPNNSMFYPLAEPAGADVSVDSAPAGHRGFIEHLLNCAKRRQERAKVNWEWTFDPDTGFGMAAACDISAGEVVVRNEEKACKLVSRQHVERNWSGLKRQWFERYAYPATGDVFRLWSDNPEEWRPIHHSNEPNTLIQGLDIIALRDIKAGEELTLDRSTFHLSTTESIDCTYVGSEYRSKTREDDNQNQVETPTYPFAKLQTPEGGLLALRGWKADEVIWTISWGPALPTPTRWSIQLDNETHAEPQPAHLHHINHSDEPNVSFDLVTSELRAIRDIVPGEELVCFYPANKWEL